MKYPIKRVFAMLVAVILGMIPLRGALPKASAEKIEATDSYVLTYNGAIESYAYGAFPYMYASPFRMRHAFNDPEAGENSAWEYTYANEIFHLVDTTKLAQSDEGTYASIAVYSADADTAAKSASEYRRINLEDATFYISGAAGRLRAVVMSSFPYIQNMDEITAAANAWLSVNGFRMIENLQVGEAMLATQQAIWEIAHGEKYTIIDPYTGCGTYDGTGVVNTLNSAEKQTSYTETNIAGLYNYLLSLEGMAPQDDAVSEATFENVTYHAQENGDGTYTVTVSLYINTVVGEGDTLTLSAACGDEVQSDSLSAGGSYSFTFQNVPYKKEVKLEINGYQTGGDVYLFDAEGDRTAAQFFVGYDNSCLPVHGEVIAGHERILNVYKTTKEAEDGKISLENIQFEIYKIATQKEIESGSVNFSETPTKQEADAYKAALDPIATVSTDALGFATYNFTQNQQPDGIYMIVEVFNPATAREAEPFFLAVPGTSDTDDSHVYTIEINSKNVPESGPEVDMNVTEIGKHEDTGGVNDPINWIIRGDVPAGISNAKEYVLSGTIDSRLTDTLGSPVVKLYTMEGKNVLLTPGTHYTLNEGKASEESTSIDWFSVSLTGEGMGYIADTLGEWDLTAEIRVYFDTVINSNAVMGENISSQAQLEYINSTGIKFNDMSEAPIVRTGGARILKTDVNSFPLSGVVFQIARQATEEELADPMVKKEKLTVGGAEVTVVFEDFYATEDLTGEEVYEVSTNNNGEAVLYGLAYGTYYIVETKASTGYNLLSEPIVKEINEFSHLPENKITVINSKLALPETGGIGTTVFTVTGITIIGAAAVLVIMNSKRKA